MQTNITGIAIIFQQKHEILLISNDPINISLSLSFSGKLILSYSKN